MAAKKRDRDIQEREISTRPGGGSLARLNELDDFRVADGSPDIRGWDVRTEDGRKVGKVDELIVDPSAMKARYIEVKVEKEIAGTDDDRWAMVPIGTARLNEDADDVIIDRVPTTGLVSREQRAQGTALTPEEERSLRETYGATSTGLAADVPVPADTEEDLYRDPMFDDQRLWERRRREREDEPYIKRADDADISRDDTEHRI